VLIRKIEMAYSHAERLSALDASFLALEDHDSHMHIGGVAVLDAGPVSRPDGGIDIDRIRALVEAGLYRLPRYRQRVVTVPFLGHPVWVDDPRFNLAYHVRHTHLPRPGDERQLKRLAGRLMSQQLDRGKPLWEMWIVEGVDKGRFAIISKIHHCMVDGVGSVELMGAVMRAIEGPDPRLDHAPSRWNPRPAPGPAGLLAGEVIERVTAPLAAARAVRRALAEPRAAARAVRDAAEGLCDALVSGFRPASSTPLNVDIGPHRRFDWTTMDLGELKAIRGRLGGTVNDVVLAILTGALRRFLRQRGEAVERLDFRAMLPVNVRTDADREAAGNRVAMLVARLPLDERDPRRRLERVVMETGRMKRSHQALGVQTLEELADRAIPGLFIQYSRLAARSRPFNIVVTNVPGPSFPVFVLGARALAFYPLVPLFRNQALGVALLSYDGRLYWGFNADWDAVPDLHELVEGVGRELALLREAAGGGEVAGLREAARREAR
jgi:WS/DGAT/MGAT family acyltransferase